MSILSLLRRLGLAAFFPVLVSSAYAADPAPPPAAPSGWVVSIGLGPIAIPSFPASGTYRVWPTGTFAWRGPNDPPLFSSPDDGFGISLVNFDWVRAGPVARIVPRRGLSNGNGNFVGLPDVGWTLELGGFAEVWLAPFLRTRLELRQGVNGHRGLVGNVAIDGILRYGAFTFSAGPRLALGNDRYMDAYFSVTPAEAAANGIVFPYQASGGVTSLGVFGAVKYDITPAWSVTLFGGYDRFMNSAAASPIPNLLGSNNQYTGGAVLAYTFSLDAL